MPPRAKHLTALLCAALAAGSAKAQGQFSDTLSGQFVHQGDRPGFELDSDYTYDDGTEVWKTPAGYVVDGASIPSWAWSLIGGPFSGNYLFASVIHDYYTDTCQSEDHDATIPCENTLDSYKTSDETHRAFYDGMVLSGVPLDIANAMYWAVTVHKSWDVDPLSGKPINVNWDRGSNFWNRVLFSKKFGTIIKYQRSTGGASFDLTMQGPVAATPDAIRRNAEGFAASVQTGQYLLDTDQLGLLSDEAFESLDTIQPWGAGQIPGSFDAQAQSFEDLTRLSLGVSGIRSPLAEALAVDPQLRFLLPDGQIVAPTLQQDLEPGSTPDWLRQLQTDPSDPDLQGLSLEKDGTSLRFDFSTAAPPPALQELQGLSGQGVLVPVQPMGR